MNFSLFYEAFNIKSLSHAIELIKTVLEKKLGKKLQQEKGINYFTNNLGHGFGVRFLIEGTNRFIRFNFDNNKEIESIDIWEEGNPIPKIRIETKNISIVKIIPQIVSKINNPDKKGLEMCEADLDEACKAIKVETISSEENECEYVKSIRKKFGTVKYADPNTVYKDIEQMVQLVIDGKRPSIIISGIAGAGKSFPIRKQIVDSGMLEDIDYTIVKGRTTIFSIYEALFRNNGKLIIYDDCDSIFEKEDGVNILKAALDSGIKRTVSWKSKTTTFDTEGMDDDEIHSIAKKTGKLPSKFDFVGRIIFITNIYYKELPSALQSRSLVVDLTLRASDVLLRIKTIMPDIDEPKEATMEIKEEVWEFFKELVKENRLNKPMSIRNYGNALVIRLSYPENWRHLVEMYS